MNGCTHPQIALSESYNKTCVTCGYETGFDGYISKSKYAPMPQGIDAQDARKIFDDFEFILTLPHNIIIHAKHLFESVHKCLDISRDTRASIAACIIIIVKNSPGMHMENLCKRLNVLPVTLQNMYSLIHRFYLTRYESKNKPHPMSFISYFTKNIGEKYRLGKETTSHIALGAKYTLEKVEMTYPKFVSENDAPHLAKTVVYLHAKVYIPELSNKDMNISARFASVLVNLINEVEQVEKVDQTSMVFESNIKG